MITRRSTGEGRERTYCIAADPVNRNYAPDGRNLISGKAVTADEGLFAAPQERPEADSHLGYPGPVIRAEVGHRITVVFRNNCSFPTAIHPHGVSYEKAHEGAGYADGTGVTDHRDDAVAPGTSHTYRRSVPERAGPGPMDGSSAVWMYHGHRDEVGDVYACLSEFLVVTAAGRAREDGSPEDVDREVFSLFLVTDENAGPLPGDNVGTWLFHCHVADHITAGMKSLHRVEP